MITHPLVTLENKYGAQNYFPLPVVITRGNGIYVWDDVGNRYFDMMSAYSAVSFGHCNPRLIDVLTTQSQVLTLVSRAFYSDKLATFLEKACHLTKQDKALPMNTGAEAVETALKAVRKWGYTVKKIAEDKAEIIVCEGNFHGRTIAIVAMSSEKQYREGFGPFPPGFKQIPFGDVNALQKAITPNTTAFLVEPIQGENGIIIPPANYLKKCKEICEKNNVLLICDEIQTGLGRTGKLLASDHDEIIPDGIILGKALGGGLLPVSLFLARKEIMDVFTPGDHGSTFGGNPLACAVGLESLNLLMEEDLIKNAEQIGKYLLDQLKELKSSVIKEVRGKGLMIGIEVNSKYSARDICLKLLKKGILTKDTHKTVIRLAPPLVITQNQIDEAFKAIKSVFTELEKELMD